jgi:hydrogenase maturation protease
LKPAPAAHRTMARILVIGYGNSSRGDDAFGQLAAERIRELVRQPDVQTICLHQLAPELMEDLSQADLAIFIDAAASGEPGSLIRRDISAQPGTRAAFTHHGSPEALLSGAQALYGRSAEGVMFSVAAADFSFGAELSPAVADKLAPVVESVLRLIAAQ